MHILIDYDNVPRIITRRGPVYLLEKILYSIGPSRITKNKIYAHLYGGWYETNRPSPRAQTLAPIVFSDFPKPITITTPGHAVTVLVNCELAYALQVNPSHHLLRTYRRHSVPYGLNCKNPKTSGCRSNPCAIQAVYDFFTNKKCINPACNVRPKDVMIKGEQKLVDTMLAADVMHFSVNLKEPNICIVSSDDDLWPAVVMALYAGTEVFHIHPKPDQSTPMCYRSSVGSLYKHIILR